MRRRYLDKETGQVVEVDDYGNVVDSDISWRDIDYHEEEEFYEQDPSDERV